MDVVLSLSLFLKLSHTISARVILASRCSFILCFYFIVVDNVLYARAYAYY